jgi:hypothetical protein
MKIYQRKWYLEHKEEQNKKSKERYVKKREIIREKSKIADFVKRKFNINFNIKNLEG